MKKMTQKKCINIYYRSILIIIQKVLLRMTTNFQLTNLGYIVKYTANIKRTFSYN